LTKHTILFLAANPLGTDRLALDREARAIQVELGRSGHREALELMTRWAARIRVLRSRGHSIAAELSSRGCPPGLLTPCHMS
jgi:hypothetical protein